MVFQTDSQTTLILAISSTKINLLLANLVKDYVVMRRGIGVEDEMCNKIEIGQASKNSEKANSESGTPYPQVIGMTHLFKGAHAYNQRGRGE